MESNMTDKEINERIARLCEWYREVDANENVTWCKHGEYRTSPPNYAESLDACRAFEMEYTFGEEEEVFDGMLERLGVIDAIFSTPLQRCEAFLRLKGQWE